MKTTIAGLILAFLIAGCSEKHAAHVAAATPQFKLSAGDLASPAEVITNLSGGIVVRFRLARAEAGALRAFTKQHLNQQVEVVFGSKVIAKPVIRSVISDGAIEQSFAASAASQARAIADTLNGK